MAPERFEEEILGWLRHNAIADDFHFRPIVTRGVRRPPRLDPRFAAGRATILLLGGPIAPASAAGLRLTVSSLRRPGPDVLDPRIKSLSYGPNILARNEALRRGADDALVLDAAGFVAEASAANVLAIRDGALVTPRTTACLPGITRAEVLGHARALGLDVAERDVSVAELVCADEVMLCGTGAEIQPVTEIDGQAISGGSPGPTTAELLRRYRAAARELGTAIG
jgi:branched-chain amino acid aminotransferase